MFNVTHHEAKETYTDFVEFKMENRETTCFEPGLLTAVANWMHAWMTMRDEDHHRVILTTSEHPGVFSLGGDLQFFSASNLTTGALTAYAHKCIAVVEALHLKKFGQNISIAAVSGDAFGGGFELALAHDLIVAHPDAQFMLPETNYGIFPGMGATSFLARRLPHQVCKQLILEGQSRTGLELYHAGIVDMLSYRPEETARKLGQQYADSAVEYRKFCEVRDALRRANPVTSEELYATVDAWTALALVASPRQRRRMAAAGRVQSRRALGGARLPAVAPGEQRDPDLDTFPTPDRA